MDLGELKNRLKKITLPIAQSETANIISNDANILSRKKSEMTAGVNPDGSIIGEYSSESYRLFKISKNPIAGGNVDLILTGSTKNNLKVESLGNSMFILRSTDEKWNSLVSKYGNQIQQINLSVFNGLQKSQYAPQLVQRIKTITGL